MDTRGEHPFTWKDLRRHALPLNTIIVADKYAFNLFHDGDRSEPFRPSLGELLDALLPDAPLVDPVHLSLMTDLERLYKKHEVKPADVCDKIRAYVDRRHPDLSVYVTVYGYPENNEHKDRFIFTNYELFSSNDSFSFFRTDGLHKETMLTYIPNSTRGSSVTAPRLKRMATVRKRASTYYFTDDKLTGRGDLDDAKEIRLASGADQNRLLDAVRDS